MNGTNVLALFSVIFVAGCSSSTEQKLTGTGTGSSLGFSQGGTLTSITEAEFLALDLNTAPGGAAVKKQPLFGMTEVSLTTNATINGRSMLGHKSFTVKSTFNGEIIEYTTVGPNLNLHAEAATNVKDQTLVTEFSGTNTAHADINLTTKSQQFGTSKVTANTINIGDLDATHLVSTVGSKSTHTLKATNRSAVSRQSSETGEFTYSGTTTLVMDDAAETVYDSNNAAMVVNFAKNTGTLSANTFTSDDGGTETISMESNSIRLDNVGGTISGVGTITVGGVVENMVLFGYVANDNKSVVGSLVTDGLTSSGGVEGGMFGVTQVVE